MCCKRKMFHRDLKIVIRDLRQFANSIVKHGSINANEFGRYEIPNILNTAADVVEEYITICDRSNKCVDDPLRLWRTMGN
jgi:hypothetical protein